MAWPKTSRCRRHHRKIKAEDRLVAAAVAYGENERLRQENERLRRERTSNWSEEQERLRQEQERLRQENERLKRQLEEAQRASKRQAAPFSRGRRKADPKPPGRKPGAAYGQRYSKAIPKQVDEVIAVPLPARCDCGGKVRSGESRVAVSARDGAQDDLEAL